MRTVVVTYAAFLAKATYAQTSDHPECWGEDCDEGLSSLDQLLQDLPDPDLSDLDLSDLGLVDRGDQDCWSACGSTSGKCAWCGENSACCRKGYNHTDCNDTTASEVHHMCSKMTFVLQDDIRNASHYDNDPYPRGKLLKDTDLNDGDLAVHDLTSLEDCDGMCKKLDSCGGWTHSTNDLRCILKRTDGWTAGPHVDATSYIKPNNIGTTTLNDVVERPGFYCKDAYTRTIPIGQCDGWATISKKECIDKCRYNLMPSGCPQTGRRCRFATWDDNPDWNGWCQLHDTCTELKRSSSVIIEVNGVTPEIDSITADASIPTSTAAFSAEKIEFVISAVFEANRLANRAGISTGSATDRRIDVIEAQCAMRNGGVWVFSDKQLQRTFTNAVRNFDNKDKLSSARADKDPFEELVKPNAYW